MMDEKLQSALAELINLTIQGKDFVIDQAPDVINQLLAWEFTISLIGFVFGVVTTIGSLVLIKVAIKSCKEGGLLYDNNMEGASCLTVIPVFIGIMLISFNLTWVQILIAPKVFLLEYASQIIN